MIFEWQHPRPRPSPVKPNDISFSEPHTRKFYSPGLQLTTQVLDSQQKPQNSLLELSNQTSEPQHLLKRPRPQADVDGEGSENAQKKKRRLRLDLITSRLSEPYAIPPTHIITRSTLRFGVWAQQKVVGRNILQKAALLNSIRIKRLAAEEAEQRRAEFAQMVSMYDNVYMTDPDDDRKQPQPSPMPRSFPYSYTPSFRSPLSLSDYDTLDYEDDSTNEDDDHEPGGEELIYSDFNALSANDDELDDDAIFFDPFCSDESE